MHCTIVRENKTFLGPPLTRLEITVGQGAYDGTSDWVQVKFMNRDGETCTTGYLNDNSYGFSFANPGKTVTIDKNNNLQSTNALGNCPFSVFRPDDKLWVLIDTTRQGLNFGFWNGYAFSRIEATFGETVWSYQPWKPVFCDGCDLKWLELKKETQKKRP